MARAFRLTFHVNLNLFGQFSRDSPIENRCRGFAWLNDSLFLSLPFADEKTSAASSANTSDEADIVKPGSHPRTVGYTLQDDLKKGVFVIL